MKQHGVLCGILLLLLLCMNGAHGFNVGSPRRLMSESSDSNSAASSTFNSEWFHPTYPHSTPTPTIAPTPTPGPTPTPTPSPKPHPPPSEGGPIGNFFKCAKGFKLVKFCVKEIYVTNSTSEIFSLETHEQIGTAAGNCPDIPGTVSPTGSGQALQSCVFTYNFFNRGRLVETGTFDPSPNGVSNNAVTGIDGEFFQALGLEHIRNFADGSGGLDEFFICEPIVKICEQEKKEHDHDGDHHDHDGDDGKNEHHKHDGDEYHP